VLPCKSGIHAHIMNLGADISIPSCLCMRYCVRDVTIKLFEIALHGGVNVRGEMMHALDGMNNLVAFSDQRSKCGTAHLKPSCALPFVASGSESTNLQYCLLVRIIVHVVIGDLEEMFVVYHMSMIIG
jgi:hypothetical protein